MPSLLLLKLLKKWLRFSPGFLSKNGADMRSVSGRRLDSTRTTVAPWSARYLLLSGPTPTHAKSATLIPFIASFRGWSEPPTGRAPAPATAVEPVASRDSRRASPRRGAGRGGV